MDLPARHAAHKSLADASAQAQAELPAPQAATPGPRRIAGYVRGTIFARYARHSMLRPGENRRRKPPKPNW
jgi:hypothetical protein